MKVFIVDDEEVSLFIIRKMLVLEGIATEVDIISFKSANEALDALLACSDEELPDVVLLDLAMPAIDGWEFLGALAPFNKRLAGRCRIYILTSSILQSDEIRAKEIPMVSGFFHKPISQNDIRKMYPHNRSECVDRGRLV